MSAVAPHTEIIDTFVVLVGPLIVETLDPDAVHRLETRGILPIPAGQPLYVHGDNVPCRFIALQSVGPYDYVPEIEDSGVNLLGRDMATYFAPLDAAEIYA